MKTMKRRHKFKNYHLDFPNGSIIKYKKKRYVIIGCNISDRMIINVDDYTEHCYINDLNWLTTSVFPEYSP